MREMVPQRRIELPTPSLPMTCSTTELLRREKIVGKLPQNRFFSKLFFEKPNQNA